jgi:hypothetical protein
MSFGSKYVNKNKNKKGGSEKYDKRKVEGRLKS